MESIVGINQRSAVGKTVSRTQVQAQPDCGPGPEIGTG